MDLEIIMITWLFVGTALYFLLGRSIMRDIANCAEDDNMSRMVRRAFERGLVRKIERHIREVRQCT